MIKVLLVDDDVDLVEANSLALKQKGHEVRAAYSAQEAHKVLNEWQPDVAVIDVMMESDSAGFDLARELHKKLPKLNMIMLSGVSEKMQLPYNFEPDETWLPVSKFLDKPVSPADLLKEVEEIVDN